MKLSRRQINQILAEEVQIAQAEVALLEESKGKEMAIQAGITLLMTMLKSKNGRKSLSAICYGIPNFIKKYICDMPESLVNRIAEKAKMDTESLFVRIPGGIAAALKVLCRVNVSVLASPLYLVGYVLETLTDEDAESITKMPTSSGPQSVTVDVPETGPSLPASSPGDAPYGGAYLDDDELDAIMQEVLRRMSARSIDQN
jgi:hypothetical protein